MPSKGSSTKPPANAPIAAPGLASQAFRDMKTIRRNIGIPFRAFPDQQPYNDVGRHVREIAELSLCPDDAPAPDLPADCREFAETPETLLRKLDEWGFEAMVIPHGTTWGFYTPPGYVYDKQIREKHSDGSFWDLLDMYLSRNSSDFLRQNVEETAEDNFDRLRLKAFMERAKTSYLEEGGELSCWAISSL